jgi:hypothetical protein
MSPCSLVDATKVLGQPAASTFYPEHEGTSSHKMFKYMSSELQEATFLKL